MGRVAGVFDNPPGFPCTPPGVDILEGGCILDDISLMTVIYSQWWSEFCDPTNLGTHRSHGQAHDCLL